MPAVNSVARLLRRAFAVLLALIILSGLSGAVTALLQHNAVKELTDHVLPLQLDNAELRRVLSDGQRGLRGYLLTGDAALLDTYHVARSDYFQAAQTVRKTAETAENPAIDQQIARADAWWALAEQQRRAAPRSDEAARFVGEGRPLFVAFETANNQLDESLSVRADRLRTQSRMLGIATTAGVLGLTLAAALIAFVTALRATRRITAPLSELVTVLGRLRAGDHTARAALDGPAEIRAVAAAVNTMADETDRVRADEAETDRLRQETRRLNTRVRQHLSVRTAVQEAATGLAQIMRADHVVVRLTVDEGEPVVATASADGAPGTPADLAALDTGWLDGGDVVSVQHAADPIDPRVPDAEVRAWAAAEAGAVVTVAVSNGDERLGAVTLLRAAGGTGWNHLEVRLVETVAADLGRGVHQARLFEQEQHLVAQLKELDTVKTDFMSTVSHELRTPLTSIAGYVEMLVDEDAGPVNPAQAKMLDVIGRNTVRLRSLIEDLLILSRIEAGTFRTHRRIVDVADVVRAGLAATAATAAKGAVAVVSELDEPLPVNADPDQLDRVVSNVLSNAVKFSPGGRVTVTGRVDGDAVVLVVSDTGMGVPENEQQRLFSRFFRASNAVHQAIPGTGLGLAIARTVVENHDGTIHLSSVPGTGTTVTVRLPAAD
jgi:signal transduction histidine kinase/CHASE3 domain sensor protein